MQVEEEEYLKAKDESERADYELKEARAEDRIAIDDWKKAQSDMKQADEMYDRALSAAGFDEDDDYNEEDDDEEGITDFGKSPMYDLRGPGGNIYAVMGQASAWLKQVDKREEAKRMTEEVMRQDSYEDALSVIKRILDENGIEIDYYGLRNGKEDYGFDDDEDEDEGDDD